jgi:hypothetical protein
LGAREPRPSTFEIAEKQVHVARGEDKWSGLAHNVIEWSFYILSLGWPEVDWMSARGWFLSVGTQLSNENLGQ